VERLLPNLTTHSRTIAFPGRPFVPPGTLENTPAPAGVPPVNHVDPYRKGFLRRRRLRASLAQLNHAVLDVPVFGHMSIRAVIKPSDQLVQSGPDGESRIKFLAERTRLARANAVEQFGFGRIDMFHSSLFLARGFVPVTKRPNGPGNRLPGNLTTGVDFCPPAKRCISPSFSTGVPKVC